ncbi:MAG: lipid A deacylase LpxR family protein [Pseudomonadota bacterium]
MLYAVQAVLLLLTAAACADDERNTHFVTMQLENDSFGENSDGYYTHGIELSFLRGEDSPPVWLATLAEWMPLYINDSKPNLVNYVIGQKVFTPLDTKTTALVADDRPYAGYLYATASVLSLIDHHENYDGGNMLDVTVGLVGPGALGEETQNTVHDILGYGRANGWEHQLQDEFVLDFVYSRFWRMVWPTIAGLEYGINPHISMALGSGQTYGAAGVMFRLGDNLKRDLNPPNIRPGFPGVPYYQSVEGVDWYGFLGYEIRWIGRDIFLDGNTFVDSHRVEKEPWVGDMQYGIAFVHRDIRLAISHMQRTREFKAQIEGSRYTAINVSFRY